MEKETQLARFLWTFWMTRNRAAKANQRSAEIGGHVDKGSVCEMSAFESNDHYSEFFWRLDSELSDY